MIAQWWKISVNDGLLAHKWWVVINDATCTVCSNVDVLHLIKSELNQPMFNLEKSDEISGSKRRSKPLLMF